MSVIQEERQTTVLPEFDDWPVREKPRRVTTLAEEAERLDRLFPGWHKRVNPRTLDLGDSSHCVLGQIGKGRPGAFSSRHRLVHDDAANRNEHVCPGAYAHNRSYRDVWRTEIKKRRGTGRFGWLRRG